MVAAVAARSFVGLDHFDQRILADNGNQLTVEPPNPTLAVGGGFVVEAVDNALQVYDKAGTPLLAAPVSMNRFMHQVSADNRTTGDLGPELTQPRAYYDWPTGRFFVTEGAALVSASGVPLGATVQFVAVTQTSDPTGAWSVYSYEITNADEAGCPCFPDVNQLGADRHGLYLSTSLVSVFTRRIVGVKLYALPKAALEAGAGGPISVFAFPLLPNDFSVFPAITPPHGRFAVENGGSEYLVEGRPTLAA